MYLSVNCIFASSALSGQDKRITVSEGDDEDEREGASSTEGPQLAAGVTQRSNSTSNGRSSQILYVITSSPGKPEHNMPGQWAGRSETTGHNASMLTPMIPHCTSLSLYLPLLCQVSELQLPFSLTCFLLKY